MKCPNCKLENPDDTMRCDCGYDFLTNHSPKTYLNNRIESKKNYLAICIWVIVLISITVIFNLSFRMIYTPAGIMGEVSKVNIYASLTYMLFWVLLSVIAGFKKDRRVLIASIIYSIMPFIGMIGSLYVGTPLAILILIVFYWGVPVQGIYPDPALVFLQLPLFFLGYIIGFYLDKVYLSINKGRNA